MAGEKINTLRFRFKEAENCAGEHLLATEGQENGLAAMRKGAQVEVAHLRDVQKALAALVVKDHEVVQAGEFIFGLKILNSREIPCRVDILHAQSLTLVEENLVHEAPQVPKNLAHW